MVQCGFIINLESFSSNSTKEDHKDEGSKQYNAGYHDGSSLQDGPDSTMHDMIELKGDGFTM